MGSGTSASVTMARHRKTDMICAIKTVKLSRVPPDMVPSLRKELDLLREMDHPNVVKLLETYESHGVIDLVMELCEGGSLLEKFNEIGFFTEIQAQRIMRDATTAVR